MKIKILLIVIVTLVLFGFSIINDKFSWNTSSFKVSNETLVITTESGKVQYSFLTDSSIEVLYLDSDKPEFPSFSKSPNLNKQAINVINEDNTLTIFAKSSKKLKVVIRKSDLTVNFYRNGELISQQIGMFDDKEIAGKNYQGFEFRLSNGEEIMGGGERVLGMDRRGHRMPLYNRAHYGYNTNSNQMNFSLPAIMSSKKYSILFDNTASGHLDIGKSKEDVLSFEAVGGRLSYIFFSAENYPNLINEYVDVTGLQPLPPRWLFGNFASRFGYTSQQEVLDTVNLFDEKDFPLDSIIVDLFWFGKDIKGHMGNLEWDKETFPEPETMLQELASKNIKTILVTEPFVLSSSNKWQEAVEQNILAKNSLGEAKRFDFYFGNTGLIDVFDENAKKWFSNIYTGLNRQGVAGVWGDLGEPEVHPDDSIHYLSDFDMQVSGEEIHNVYGHEWGKMVFENHKKINPNTRSFMMMRSGFAGSQRYGMIPWTGDVDRSWKGLEPQVELSLQMSLFAMAYTHSDLGGFAGGTSFDKEMYIRWLQYGAFQPLFRPHAQAHIPPEPIYHDQETIDILREYVKLRYRLLPYNYTLAYQNSTTGLPLMRPLFFSDESNLSLIDEKQNYFWGDAFFISPIISPNQERHEMTLPSGIWFDFWNDKRYLGNRNISIPVKLDSFPVLVKAGSFVPMIESINNSSEYSSKELTVHYYADSSINESSGEMYEDDGISSNSIETKAFDLLTFKANQNNKQLKIDFDKKGLSYVDAPKTRKISLVVHNWQDSSISINHDNRLMDVNEYHYDQKKSTLTVNFGWLKEKTQILIKTNKQALISESSNVGKPVIYQVFTRLFGNKNTTNKLWGTKEENGVGKFSDFTDEALKGIKAFGTSHIWYTGVPHHALIGDYTKYGITNDDPDIVKGRAGSPYAVKDYYNVNPDLADDPAKRLQEFKALIDRTHKHGMKVIIDIVPNHIARDYRSLSKPKGVKDFGIDDDLSTEYKRDNNFYYIVGENFKIPERGGYKPLNGENHPLSDNYFKEEPAKWTGNGTRNEQPDINDWYETVKVNYGVKPDGSYDFHRLPASFASKSTKEHLEFWKGKEVPDSWKKFKEIVLYWTDFGVDGFRYDMAEMVPVEFWSYLNSSIKEKNPDATLVAEVYNPAIYRDFISLGKMDYLYDKVDFYDTLKLIMQGERGTSSLLPITEKFSDIDGQLLHFLENHDEQRIASSGFVGDAKIGKPAMVVSSLIGKGPNMIYFGQALGEAAELNAGFGKATRTSIFDYWGVPSLQRWMNGGEFDGGKLTDEEKVLREYYVDLLSFSAKSSALKGDYYELHSHNLEHDDNLENNESYNEKLFSFARFDKKQKLVVISNFSKENYKIDLKLPRELIANMKLKDSNIKLKNIFSKSNDKLASKERLLIEKGLGKISLSLAPLESKVYVIK